MDILQILLIVSLISPILDDRIGRVFAQEAALYSNHLGVAGRVDCVAEFDGNASIDKTSRKKKCL